jgi:hypothetical protein
MLTKSLFRIKIMVIFLPINRRKKIVFITEEYCRIIVALRAHNVGEDDPQGKPMDYRTGEHSELCLSPFKGIELDRYISENQEHYVSSQKKKDGGKLRMKIGKLQNFGGIPQPSTLVTGTDT